jgi:hypothetical protein
MVECNSKKTSVKPKKRWFQIYFSQKAGGFRIFRLDPFWGHITGLNSTGAETISLLTGRGNKVNVDELGAKR